MPAIPTVNITVVDQGASAALAVPQSSVQLIIGCAIGGTVNQPIATTSAQQLQQSLIGGPLMEAGGLVCQAGSVALCIPVPIVSLGAATAVVPTTPGGSTSVVTTTLDSTHGAWDAYFVMVRCLTGGTIGTSGIIIQVSLDAGRNWGAPIQLGTANSYVIGSAFTPVALAGGTGIQLNFGAGTMVANDYWRFSTTAPAWNNAGVAAAIAAFGASQYGVEGVGSAHVVGISASGDVTAIQTAMQALVAGFIFQRVLVTLRDAAAPAAWGGSGETETTWVNALATSMAGEVAQARVCADGGFYNTPSPYVNASGGSPAYRRPLTWSHAVRRTRIGLQRRAGAVADGAYSTITVNPATDPSDGFIYHDERVNPGLNAARIGSAMTWPKQGAGFFQCQEPLLCPPGSQFVEVVIGNVLDAACDIGYAAGVKLVSSDIELQANGTLDPVQLNTIQGSIQQAESQGLVAPKLVSRVRVQLTPSWNVAQTSKLPVVISVLPKGYVNSVDETVNLSTGA